MGAKYSSNSISGYNSTPPPDDGSTSEANKVKWSTIKNKITDPVKALAEAIDTDINTALNYGPISVVSEAVTLGASHNNQFIEMSGASVPTLATANGLGAGWFVDVKNTGAETITVSRALASDMINDVTADVVMGPLDYIRFVVNAAADGFHTVNSYAIATMAATQTETNAGTRSDVFITPEALSPPTVSEFTGGRMIYFPSTAIANGEFQVQSNVSASTWRSVGPTGSGADNIWTALDHPPSGFKAVRLSATATLRHSSAADVSMQCGVRTAGSASPISRINSIFNGEYYLSNTGNAYEFHGRSIICSVDSSGVIDVYWSSNADTVASIYLEFQGWVE